MERIAQDRGQLFLSGALVFATILLTIALLINGVAVTETTTTSQHTQSRPSAAAYQSTAANTALGIINQLNQHQNETTYGSLQAEYTTAIQESDTLLTDTYDSSGQLTGFSPVVATNGTRIIHSDANRRFTSAGGDHDWTLTTETKQTRRFRMMLDSSAIDDNDEFHDADDYPTKSSLDDPDMFRVQVVDDAGEEWVIYVFRAGPDNDIYVRVGYPDGTVSDTCEADTGDNTIAEVDISEAETNNGGCPPLQFFSALDAPYQISFKDGDDAMGTYTLTVDQPIETLPTWNFHTLESRDSPYVTRVIYGSTIAVEYYSETTSYNGTIRVAPGEQR